MNSKLKALGLALVAVFAINAMVASSASATTDKFTLEGTPTTLTGAQVGKVKFEVAGQSVECTTDTFHATATGTSVTEVTGIATTYAGCTYAGNAATVTLNGCTYTLTGETKVNAKGETHGVTHIVCTGTNHITIDLPSIAADCTLTIIKSGAANGSLTATNGVTYTNDGTGTTRGLLIHLTTTVPVVGDNCTQLTGNGTMTGTMTVEGETENTNVHTGIEVS